MDIISCRKDDWLRFSSFRFKKYNGKEIDFFALELVFLIWCYSNNEDYFSSWIFVLSAPKLTGIKLFSVLPLTKNILPCYHTVFRWRIQWCDFEMKFE